MWSRYWIKNVLNEFRFSLVNKHAYSKTLCYSTSEHMCKICGYVPTLPPPPPLSSSTYPPLPYSPFPPFHLPVDRRSLRLTAGFTPGGVDDETPANPTPLVDRMASSERSDWSI